MDSILYMYISKQDGTYPLLPKHARWLHFCCACPSLSCRAAMHVYNALAGPLVNVAVTSKAVFDVQNSQNNGGQSSAETVLGVPEKFGFR